MTMAIERTDVMDPATSDMADAPVDGALLAEDGGAVLRVPMVAGAAILSTLAAAWMATGLLRGTFAPRAIAFAGAAIGVGIVTMSMRMPKPAVFQYLVVPVAAIVGAVFVAPTAGGGTANLPGLVGEAISGGGLLTPPVAFDPGWRFLLVLVFAIVGAASLSLALAHARPRLAVVVPLPITFGTALLQPKGSEVVASTVGLFLVVTSLALAYGSEIAADATINRGFEVRRLARAGGLVLALMAAIVVLAQTSFLFPATEDDRVVPPRRPPASPPEKDRELFKVESDRPGPWRVGVLDSYDGEAWLLPSVDQRRIVKLADGKVIPTEGGSTGPRTEVARFTLTDLRGRALPVPPGLLSIAGPSQTIEYDPQTGVPRLQQRLTLGFRYEAVVVATPGGAALNSSPPPSPSVASTFTPVPPPPNAVRNLLLDAPPAPLDRIQYLRDRLYRTVVASGPGTPKDVPPSRAAELLSDGAEATPYEITATEALLARWAGLPARIGFGYYGGDVVEGGTSIRPKHGAAWLEVYFEGPGWVALVGTPPQAKASLSEAQKNEQEQVKPSDDLAMQVLIPVQRRTFRLLFEIVRYYVVRTLPIAVAILAVWSLLPVLCKLARRRRRERWAAARGPRARTLVAYASFRDRCNDLNVGEPGATPLEFTWPFADDSEHDELAWAVTRTLWGDLKRDARDGDARAVERMVDSLGRRVVAAQPGVNRLLGALARASLRDPYSADIPNLWPDGGIRGSLRGRLSGAVRLVRLGRSARVAPVLVIVLLASAILGGCVSQGGFDGSKSLVELPEHLVPEAPERLLSYTFVRELKAEEEYGRALPEALVTDGRIYSIHDGATVQGSVQVALFRSDLDGGSEAIRRDVEAGVGGSFSTYRLATATLRVRHMPEIDLYLWFPPERNVVVAMYLRKQFLQSEEVVRAIVARTRGIDPSRLGPSPMPTAATAQTSTIVQAQR